MCSYKSVTVCVVLVMIVGNVSGFALSRLRRDLEKTILDYFGSSNKEEQMYETSSTSRYNARSYGAEEAYVQSTPISMDLNVLSSIFGPQTEPHIEQLKPNFLSFKPVERKTRKGVEDKINIITTAPPPPEAMTDLENSSINNISATFKYDDRFLTEDLLRTKLVENYKRINAKPRQVADPGELELRPLDNGRNLEPMEPTPEPPLKTPGSSGPRLPLPPRRSVNLGPPPPPPEPTIGERGSGPNLLFSEPEPIGHKPEHHIEDSKSKPDLVTKSTSNASRIFFSSFLYLTIAFFILRNIF